MDVAFVVEVHQGCGLEGFGHKVGDVLAHFPAGRYRRQACAEGQEMFVPLVDDAAVPPGRFHLLAEPRPATTSA